MTARDCRGPNPGSVQQLFCAPHATDRLTLLFFEDFPTTSDFGTSRRSRGYSGGCCQSRSRCRWNSHRQRGNAANAGFDAKVAVTVLGARRRLVGRAVVADNHIRLCGRVGNGLCRVEARDQSGERNCISGRERDNALPKWPLDERHAHYLVSAS